MSSSEFELDDSDQEIAADHNELVQNAKNLERVPKIQKHQRSELALVDSKYNLTKTKYGNDSKLETPRSLKKSKKKGVQEPVVVDPEQNVLPKPLEKPAAERIKRKVGYENTKQELKKWVGIVARNRTASSVSFPLNHSSMNMEPSEKFFQRYHIQSELEKKLAELKPKEESDEEDDQFPMTLEEIIQQKKETAKFRAQQSYMAAKARRQNKIKSKKFHRIQRKEKMKKAIEEFEKLKESDPEAALKKLQEIDNARIQERMTLRHKNTGKWAQSQMIKAKYDKETRQVLAEQLAVSRDLTQKVKKDDDSDDDVGDEQPVPLPSSDKENPWMYPVKTDSEITEFISNYRKFWDQRNKEKKNQSEVSKNDSANADETNDSSKSFKTQEIQDSSNDPDSARQVEANKSDESESEAEPVAGTMLKKKLQKTSKDKLGIKSSKSKITKVKKSKVKVGTSSWSVVSENSEEPMPNATIKKKAKKKKSTATPTETKSDSNDATEDFDIDEMFDSLEEKMQATLSKALAQKKRQLEKEEQHQQKKKKNKKRKKTEDVDDVEELGLKGQRIARPSFEKPIEESASSNPLEGNSDLDKITNITDFNRRVTSQPNKAEIDPNKFINIKPKHVKTLIPDEAGEGLDALDDNDDDDNEPEEDQQQMISEAFADDDVVDEFRKEKQEEIKKSQPGDVDLTLPGWGSWGGKNIKVSNRKRRRFIVKFPKEEKRKDENKGDVVIIEEKSSKIKKHLVSELPFPYTSVQDYEASLRAPIGRDFVPEKTFSQLTLPAVRTKMGTVIEPMNEDALVKVKTNDGKKKKKNDDKPTIEFESSNKKLSRGKGGKKGQLKARKLGKKVQNGVKA